MKNKFLEYTKELLQHEDGYNVFVSKNIGLALTPDQRYVWCTNPVTMVSRAFFILSSNLLDNKKFLFPDGKPTGDQTWTECKAFCTTGMLAVIRKFREKYRAKKDGDALPIKATMLTTLAFLVERRLKSKGFSDKDLEKDEVPFLHQYLQVRIFFCSFAASLPRLIADVATDVFLHLPTRLQTRAYRPHQRASVGIKQGKSTCGESKSIVIPRLCSCRTA
jgi:hypothetical protein